MSSYNINIDLIEDYFARDKSIKVLDIGAGDCSEIFRFYDKSKLDFERIVCVDSGKDLALVPSMEINFLYNNTIGYKRKNSDKIFEYIDHEALDFLVGLEEKFDLIIFSQFLHFFSHDKVIDFLWNARCKLNPGGIIFIKAANTFHDHHLKRHLPVFNSELISTLEFRFDIDFVSNESKWYEIIITSLPSKRIEHFL